MPAGEFHTGDESEVTLGGNVLPARSWTLTITGNNKNVSNSRDGRFRIKGFPDASGTVEVPFDGGIVVPRVGSKLVGTFFTSKPDSEFFRLNIIVDSITPGMSFDGETVLSIAFSQADGVILYPSYA